MKDAFILKVLGFCFVYLGQTWHLPLGGCLGSVLAAQCWGGWFSAGDSIQSIQTHGWMCSSPLNCLSSSLRKVLVDLVFWGIGFGVVQMGIVLCISVLGLKCLITLTMALYQLSQVTSSDKLLETNTQLDSLSNIVLKHVLKQD